MSGILLIYLVGPYTLLGAGVRRPVSPDSLTGRRPRSDLRRRPVPHRGGPLRLRGRGARARRRGPRPSAGGEWSRFCRVSLPLAALGDRRPGSSWPGWRGLRRSFGGHGSSSPTTPYTLPGLHLRPVSAGPGCPTRSRPTTLAVVTAIRRPRSGPSGGHGGGPRTSPVIPAALPATAPGAGRRSGWTLDHRLGDFRLQLLPRGRKPPAVDPRALRRRQEAPPCAASPGLYGSRRRERAVRSPGPHQGGDPSGRRLSATSPQEPSLLPHLNVWDQLLLSGRAPTPGVAAHWLSQLRLLGLEARRPGQLSGGPKRQRVALARALCRSPRSAAARRALLLARRSRLKTELGPRAAPAAAGV